MDINATLKMLVADTAGVECITVTDGDGVTMASVSASSDVDEEGQSQLAFTYQMVIDHLPKFELGEKKSLTLCYKTNTVILLNVHPLIVIILARPDVGIGALRELRRDIERVVEEINKATSSYAE